LACREETNTSRKKERKNLSFVFFHRTNGLTANGFKRDEILDERGEIFDAE
jgi:hypothetical protein